MPRIPNPRLFALVPLLGLLTLNSALAQPNGKLAAAPSDCPKILGPSIDEIFEIARGWGSAELETSSGNRPMISGRIEGIKYALFLYDCDDATRVCQSAQFVAGFSDANADLARINAWNAERRFGKAWLDDEEDPVLELNVTLVGGMTRAHLDDVFDWWRVVGSSYREYIYEGE